VSWTYLGETTPTAAKPHRCYLCGLTIPKGERHIYRRGADGGEFYADRMHFACHAKTEGWSQDEWEGHDASEFRRYELGIDADGKLSEPEARS
jgi:hypothetical protein